MSALIRSAKMSDIDPSFLYGILPFELTVEYTSRLSPEDLKTLCQAPEFKKKYCNMLNFWERLYKINIDDTIPTHLSTDINKLKSKYMEIMKYYYILSRSNDRQLLMTYLLNNDAIKLFLIVYYMEPKDFIGNPPLSPQIAAKIFGRLPVEKLSIFCGDNPMVIKSSYCDKIEFWNHLYQINLSHKIPSYLKGDLMGLMSSYERYMKYYESIFSYPDYYNDALGEFVNIGAEKLVKILLQRGANPNKSFIRNETSSLQMAVMDNRLDIVKLLIESGADPNIPNRLHGSTPLMSAAKRGYNDIIEYLLQNGADINAKNMNNENSLFLAIDGMEKSFIGWRDEGTAQLASVILLLERGIETDIRDKTDFTPLVAAAYKGGYEGQTEIVEMLLLSGLDPNVKSMEGRTPLMYAAQRNNVPMVRLLLLWGADPNATDDRGNTVEKFTDNNEIKLLLQNYKKKFIFSSKK